MSTTTPAPAATAPLANATTLELLRGVVAAKQVHWDVLNALEARVAPGGVFPDSTADDVECFINVLAAGSDDAESVTEEHVAMLMHVMVGS